MWNCQCAVPTWLTGPALHTPRAGAKGNAPWHDDAPALNRALQAANDSQAELIFGGKTYFLNSTLLKGQGTRVFSLQGGCARPNMEGSRAGARACFAGRAADTPWALPLPHCLGVPPWRAASLPHPSF